MTGSKFFPTEGIFASKAAAERLVRAAQQQGGISAVARLSIVVGRYRDGTIGQFTNIYALIRPVTAGRIHVLPASPCASLDLVPIDHVIGGLTDIAERMAAASGRTYHLVSGAPVPVAAFRRLGRYSPGMARNYSRYRLTQLTTGPPARWRGSGRLQKRSVEHASHRRGPTSDSAILSELARCYCLHTARAQAACQGVDRQLTKTTGLHRTMAKVCKSDGQGTFAGTQGNGEVAPMNEPALAGGVAVRSVRFRRRR